MRLGLSGDTLPENASHFASRLEDIPTSAHDAPERTRVLLTVASEILRSCPPSGEIRNMPTPNRANAICDPSGDQAGAMSYAGLVVSRSGCPPLTSLT